MSDQGEKGVEAAIQYAKKYLEDILSFFGLNTDIYATTEDGEVIELHVPSTHLNGFLIGQRGDTMRALQFTVSSALKNQGYEVVRVNVDVADYKKGRADRLSEKAEEWMKKVQESGEQMELQPMNPADRRTVHKLAGEYGVETESVGEGRDRHIVLKPTKNSTPEQKQETEEEAQEQKTETGQESEPEQELNPSPESDPESESKQE
jgi:spoIIIJ-associated protein